jgi:integrase
MRKAPSRGTISQEAVLLRMLFKQASKWGYIKLHQIPDIEVKPVLPNPRPTFDIDEFKILEQVSLQRVIEPRLNRNVRRDRTLLHCHLMIASFTGMRPTEPKNLNWGDILRYSKGRLKAIGDRDLRIRARGKGKSRTLIPMLAAVPFFDLLWDLWVIDHGTEPDDSFPVFSSLSGKRIESQKKGLNELLKAAGLIADFRGVKRTSYSFRHFYITQQLMAGVDVFLVAKNTGTSPQMIDKFYGHVKLELMANELRPAWKARS